MWPTFASSPTGLPGLELTEVLDLLLHFLFAMLRIGAFVLSAPLFGAQYISLPVRIMITICLTTALIGRIPIPPVDDLAQLSAAFIAISELAIGLTAGLFLQVLFAAVLLAGDRIANTAGLGLASQIDPATGTQSPVIGQFFTLFLLGVFVATDVHLVVIKIVLDSYTLVPIGVGIQASTLRDAVLQAAGLMFYDAARLMMPVVIVLLVVNIVIGVITRSAPQLNIFAFGFPLTMSVTLLLLWLTAPSLGPAFAGLLDQAVLGLDRMFAGLADG